MDKRKKKDLIISILILMLFVISCKDEPKRNVEKSTKNKDSEVWLKFDFPDTVYRNKSYDGKIEFKSVLDSITTNVLEETDGKNRYVIFSLTKTRNINYDTEQLKKIKPDTFGASSNRIIPFTGIKFSELGTNYIDGIMNDQATIEDRTKDKNADDRVRIIENEIRATHKVIVIEKP